MSSIIIESIRNDGSQFRPSDWVERISDSIGSFESDRRLHYAKECHPGFVNGEKCLIVDNSLSSTNQEAFDYIMNFVKSNDLKSSGSN